MNINFCRWLVILLIFMSGLPAPVLLRAEPATEPVTNSAAEVPDENSRRLGEIQAELQAKRAQLEEIQKKEKNVLIDLLKSKNFLQQTRGELQTKQYQLIKNEQKVMTTRRELDDLRNQFNDEWQDFHKRIRDIYKNSQSHYLEVIFGSRSLNDFVSRSFFFEKLIAKDIEFINRMRAAQAQVGRKKQLLEEQSGQIKTLTKSIALKKDQLQLEVSEKQKVHESLALMRAEYEKQVAELEENSRQIEALLRQDKELSGQVAEATGQMIWPVPGRITSGFGYRRHPIFRVIKFHSGLDLAAPYGYPIKAADGGVVVDARYWGGYGNVVIVSHGNGLSTVYAHMSRFYVSRNQRVAKGQTLGLVGSTGYSTGPHCHFEVRKNGTTVNPKTYLP